MEHIVRADDIGAHRLHGEELAGRHLLQRRCVENVVHAGHSIPQALRIPHIADVEFHLVGKFRMLHLQLVAHIILLFLITGENADLANVRVQKLVQNRMAKTTGTAGNE